MSQARPYVAERPTRVRFGVIYFAVSLAMITYIDRVCISNAAPLIRRDLGLSLTQMGRVFSIFAVAYSIFEMPCGYLCDRIGPRRVLMRVVLWWSFFTAATGWTWNYPSIMVTRFLFGAGEAGCFPSITRAFTIWLPHKERTRAQGIVWLSARWGGAITPLLAIAVIELVGWRHAFEIFGSLGVVWALVFYRWFRDNPLENSRMNAAERELLKDIEPPAKHGHAPWGPLVRSPHVWLLCVQYFCLSYGWYFYITWLPTYLREARGLTLGTSALLGGLPLFFGGIGNMAGVALTSLLLRLGVGLRRARKTVCCLGFIGASAFLILSTRMHDPVAAILAISMASFSNDLVMAGAWSSTMDIGGKYAGTVSGAMNMFGNFAGIAAPLLVGYLLEQTTKPTMPSGNWNLTFYISAAIYSGGIFCWLAMDPLTPLQAE
jgi:MFS transporter, ACS family, glucarate transporter